MEKIICPAGTKQSLYEIFTDLQNSTDTNLKRRFDRFVASYGIIATVKNDTVISNELEVSKSGATTLAVESGTALTNSFNYLKTLTQTTISLNTIASGIYTVIAKSDPYTDTPVTIVNGYLYNQAGADTTDTREHPGIIFEVINSGVETNISGIYLADINWNGVNDVIVTDRRIENIFSLDDTVIPDNNIVKKDRDSSIVGSLTIALADASGSHIFKNASAEDIFKILPEYSTFSKKVGFGGKTSPEHEVDVTGTVRATTSVKSDLFTSDTSDDVLIQPKETGGKIINKLYDATGRIDFQDSDGNVLGYFDKDKFYFNKPVDYNFLVSLSSLTVTDETILPAGDKITLSGVKNSTFKLGMGVLNDGAGVNVLTEDPDPTTPTNFRIYDIKPTENKNEKKAYVSFKWNYDKIYGEDKGNYQFRVLGILGGGTINETSEDLIGKYLYFTGSGNKYLIMNWNNSTKYLTLEDYLGEEPNLPNYPCRIIDLGTGYTFSMVTKDSLEEDANYIRSQTCADELDASYILNPQYSKKLELDCYSWIRIRTLNEATKSSYILLPSGIYDPDHTPGGQTEINYNYPLKTTLPNLVNDGSLTLTPTIHGFNIDVGGWNDPEDIDKNAHEFQYGFTTLDALDWNNTTQTTIETTSNRHIPVNTNDSVTIQVGVRALQNKQIVSLVKSGSLVTGGGGIPPNAIKITGADFSVRRIAGSYSAKGGGIYNSSEEDFYLKTIMWSGLCPAPGTLDGKYIDFETEGYNNQRIFSNTGGLTDSYIWLNPGVVDDDLPAAPENFTIATTKTGRRVFTSNLPADMKITYIYVEVFSGRWLSAADPAVIRVYQDTQESAAGTKDIAVKTGTVTGSLDVSVKYAYGTNRKVIVDLWDPDTGSPNNTASVSGHVDIYGELILAKTETGPTALS